jgi:hypothetical protein
MAEEAPPIWRGWHVVGRFLPMIFLGALFLLFGLSPWSPHYGPFHWGIIFAWIGAILIIGAVLGTLFTKCPICYQSNWIWCMQERDVVRMRDRHQHEDYYVRDLAYPQDEP